MVHGTAQFGQIAVVNIVVTGSATGTPTVTATAASPTPTPSPTATGTPPSTATPTSSAIGTPPSTSTLTPSRTRTSTPTATQPGTGIGGRGLAIRPTGQGVLLTWQGGTGQTGYLVVRLFTGAVTTLPPLDPSKTSLLDSTTPPGAVCYTLLPLGTTPQAVADLECAGIGFHSASGAPQDLTLRLDQSTTATLSWSVPAGVAFDGYMLAMIGGPFVPLPTSTTTASVPITGLTCFAVGTTKGGALVGYSDIVCGAPGFSNMGTAASAAQANTNSLSNGR